MSATTDNLTARRKAIDDAAMCVGCGATRAACDAEAGKDPHAPPWFGCCAMGTDMRPCRHEVDVKELKKLLDEVAAGTVHPPTPPRGPRPSREPKLYTGLHQGEWWQPKVGPPVRIVDMDATWRLNTVRFLERQAKRLHDAEQSAMVYGPQPFGEMASDCFDQELDELMRADPVEWLRSTDLLQALSKDLPTKPKKLALLTERAKHWSTCPRRKDLDAPVCECRPVSVGGEFGNGSDEAEI